MALLSEQGKHADAVLHVRSTRRGDDFWHSQGSVTFLRLTLLTTTAGAATDGAATAWLTVEPAVSGTCRTMQNIMGVSKKGYLSVWEGMDINMTMRAPHCQPAASNGVSYAIELESVAAEAMCDSGYQKGSQSCTCLGSCGGVADS